MTRSEKVNKLGNAIRRFRGLFDSSGKKWIHPPDKNEIPRVVRWLVSLKVNNPRALLKEICEFKSVEEFQKFMKQIGEPTA
jgi:hypothetical protein